MSKFFALQIEKSTSKHKCLRFAYNFDFRKHISHFFNILIGTCTCELCSELYDFAFIDLLEGGASLINKTV